MRVCCSHDYYYVPGQRAEAASLQACVSMHLGMLIMPAWSFSQSFADVHCLLQCLESQLLTHLQDACGCTRQTHPPTSQFPKSGGKALILREIAGVIAISIYLAELIQEIFSWNTGASESDTSIIDPIQADLEKT